MDAVTGRSLLFPCREKSDDGRQKNDSGGGTDRKAGSDPAGLSVSFRRMRQRTGMGNAHGSQTYEACDAEAGRRNGSGTDQEVP